MRHATGESRACRTSLVACPKIADRLDQVGLNMVVYPQFQLGEAYAHDNESE